MTTPQFDVYQQVFSLSQAANVLFSATGTQAELQAQAEQALKFYMTFQGQTNTPDPSVPPVIGDWTLVWGPVVWKDEPNDATTGPSNTIFIAHNPSVIFPGATDPVDTYVVAVAATAVHSPFDIINEDAGVSSVVQFDAWLGSKGWSTTTAPPQPSSQVLAFDTHPFIANGTATGVWALLSNPPPSGTSAVSPGTYLAAAVSAIPSTSAVVITGHSLGGALSPTLAMVLQQKGWLASYQKDPTVGPAGGIVYVYPTAGASPGNPTFATLYNTTFPTVQNALGGSSYKVWNALLYNKIDLVPHAWAEQDNAIDDRYLGMIPGLYGNAELSETYAEAWGLVQLAVGKEGLTNCNYTPLQGNEFAGTFLNPVPNIDGPITVGTPPSNLSGFETEALYQHIAAYSVYIGIEDLPKIPGLPQAVKATEPA